MTPTDSPPPPAGAQTGAGRDVVVADDNHEFRAMLAEHLKIHGFVVHHAANGLEAVLAIKRIRPAAVVLDLLMPRLGGLEALNRIRAFAPTVRVVVVTAAEDDNLRRQALLMGAVALLKKPILVDDLVEVLSGPTTRIESRQSGDEVPAAPQERPTGAVLIVDDERDVRDTLQEFCESQGYGTLTAANGQEAIRRVQAQPPQVVLLDIVMPGLGGIEALTTIRGIAPETRVIMISGSSDLETARRALAYGAFDYVPKPVNLRHLSEVLAAAFVQPWR